jgi:hypothetical protein
MKALVHWISKATPQRALSLIGVGLSMLICSSVADERISGTLAREVVQLLIIAGGLIATAILFRRGTDADHR